MLRQLLLYLVRIGARQVQAENLGRGDGTFILEGDKAAVRRPIGVGMDTATGTQIRQDTTMEIKQSQVISPAAVNHQRHLLPVRR